MERIEKTANCEREVLMGFPEKLAQSCVTSDLGAKDEQIRSVEHVAALSGASGIGSDLMRAKDYDIDRKSVV